MNTIRLRGKPTVDRDGRPQRPPRGRKFSALLSYVRRSVGDGLSLEQLPSWSRSMNG